MNKIKIILITSLVGLFITVVCGVWFVKSDLFSKKSEDESLLSRQLESDNDYAQQNNELSQSSLINNSLTSSGSVQEMDFHKLSGIDSRDVLKLFNPALDTENHRLYVVGSKTTNVVVIDTQTDEIIDSFDVGVLGGFLIFSSKKLYNYNFTGGECNEINPDTKKAVKVSLDTCAAIAPKDQHTPKKWDVYSFLETGYQQFSDGTTGFPADWTQDMNGAYGVIEIEDTAGKLLGKIAHGPDALYFVIDSSQKKLYTTNTGDGSVSVYDLSKLKETNYCKNSACKIKEIDVGTSADQILVDSKGKIYLRNRLGGSVIYVYDQNSDKFNKIDNENHVTGGIGMWPTGMELNSEETKLYVLSHYDARIDVVDTNTYKVIGSIKFNTELKPRTDSISNMIIDKSRERIFAVFPELGMVGVADGKNKKVLGTINLTNYGFTKKINKGPNKVKISINEKTNILSVELTEEKKQLYFNADTLKQVEGGDSVKNIVLYNEFTGATYEVKSRIISPGVSQTMINEVVGGVTKKQCVLDKVVSGIPPDLEFDYKNNAFYVAYFETAIVKKYDISKCSSDIVTTSAPAGSGQNTNQQQAPNTQKPPQAPVTTQGKCGDGVCGPVEKEKGVCPEDCK